MGDNTGSSQGKRTIMLAAVLALFGSLLVVSASPASAVAQMTVTPSTDLVDGQSVQVSATGFVPETTWGAAVCMTDVADIGGCDLSNTILSSTDTNGDIDATMSVRRYIVVGGDVIDCGVVDQCVLAGANLGADLVTPLDLENVAVVPLHFDPDVPALPPLEVSLTVESVSSTEATGTVTCNRDARATVDVSIQQNTRGSSAYAWGYIAEHECGPTPSPFSVAIQSGGRFHRGVAQYFAGAYAYDGVDGADDYVEGELAVQNSAKPKAIESNSPGTHITITDFSGTRTDGQAVIAVEVVCDMPIPISVNANVSQFAGFDVINGYGYLPSVPCDGAISVEVPIMNSSGLLVGGPAIASVYVDSYSDEEPYFYDSANAMGAVSLRGHVRPEPTMVVEPSPDSTITIDSIVDGAVTGKLTCPLGAVAEVDASLTQRRGRTTDTGYGYTYGLVCTGEEQPFEAMLFTDGLRNGKADAVVFAYAYEIDENGYYQYIYQDHQAATVHIR